MGSSDQELLQQIRAALSSSPVSVSASAGHGSTSSSAPASGSSSARDRELAAKLRRVAALLDRHGSTCVAQPSAGGGLVAGGQHASPPNALLPNYCAERSSQASAAMAAAATAAASAPLQPGNAGVIAAAQQQGVRIKSNKRGRLRLDKGDLDFSRYRQRYVALRLMYLGGAYRGFATQAEDLRGAPCTVEGVLFAALRKTRLVPADNCHWQDVRYSRCGRTDKGVSALGQVVALKLRSCALASGPPCCPSQEMDYPALLNRVLPTDVRVLGWAPVEDDDFSARFSCLRRHYKYFIVQRDGDLDIPAMQDAAARFVGQHDFRNFCRMDVEKVHSFERRVEECRLAPAHWPWPSSSGGGSGGDITRAIGRLEGSPGAQWTQQEGWQQQQQQQQGEAGRPMEVGRVEEAAVAVSSPPHVSFPGGMSVYVLDVVGSAFLWHQVRCMVAVLMMVGRRQEPPSIVSRLLDLSCFPTKPQYAMAPEGPLLLYDCQFEGLHFRQGAATHDAVRQVMLGMMEQQLVGLSLMATIDQRYREQEEGGGVHGQLPHKPARHLPLQEREREASWQERLAVLQGRGKPVARARPDSMPAPCHS